MRSNKKVLTAVCLMAMTLCLCLAACGEKSSKLTLQAAPGGTIGQDTYTVTIGDDLGDFLKEIAPTPDEGLTFAGWFNGEAQVKTGDKMPSSALTLQAKYDAPYTVSVYKEGETEGDYSASPEVKEGKARYLDPFEVNIPTPEGFVLDPSKENVLSTDSLKAGTQFTVYFMHQNEGITYDANLPEGTTAEKEIPFTPAQDGKAVTADGNAFQASPSLRFAGWATEKDGKPVYAAGETITNVGRLKLYAVWDRGYTDLFGRSEDYLFVSSAKGEEGELFLRRRGFDEDIKGVLEGDSFYFENAGKELLNGRLLPDGRQYFYYEDLTAHSYTVSDGTGATLTFEGVNKAIYTEGESVTEGTYTLDGATNEYLFESKTLTFHFLLGIETEGSGIKYVFHREPAESAERGFYAYKDRSGEIRENNLLFFNGMVDKNGMANATAYTVENGVLRAASSYFYYLGEETEPTYYIQSQDELLFKVRLDATYTGEVCGQKLAGSFIASDGTEGLYPAYDDINKGTPDEEQTVRLELDGFGKAVFGAMVDKEGNPASPGKEGTYEFKTYSFDAFSTEYGYYTAGAEWIVLTVEGKKTNILLTNGSMYGNYYTTASRDPYMLTWKDGTDKIYGENNLGVAENASFFFLDDNNVAVYAWYEDVETGKTIYEYIDLCHYEAKEGERNVFICTSMLYAPTQFLYKVETGNRVSVSLPLGMAWETEDGKIGMDDWGTFRCDNRSYPYGTWEMNEITDYINGEFVYRSIVYPDGEVDLIVTSEFVGEEGQEQLVYTYTPIEEQRLFTLVLKRFALQDMGFESLYMLEDGWEDAAKNGGASAAVTLLLEESYSFDQYEAFVLFGTVEEIGEGEYSFTIDEGFDEFYKELGVPEDLYYTYYSIEFTKGTWEGKDAFIAKDPWETEVEQEDGTTLKLDGYGKAEYTPAGGTKLVGSYEYLATTEDEGVFLRFVEDGKTTPRYLYCSENTVEERTQTEAGVWYYFYEFDGSFGFFYNTYIVLFGDGTLSYGTDSQGYPVFGTYEDLGTQIDYAGVMWKEYTVSLLVDGVEDEFHIIMSDLTRYELDRVFKERNEAQVMQFVVEGGGSLSGNGYSQAIYTDGTVTYFGEMGRVNVYDKSPKAADYSAENDFEDGKQVLFHAFSMQQGGKTETFEDYVTFLFDVTDEGIVAVRDDYSGTFAYFERGKITEETMYLDGHGKAFLYDAQGKQKEVGTYRPMPEVDDYTFLYHSETQSFRYRAVSYNYLGEDWFIYNKLEDEDVYATDELSRLILGGYGIYTDASNGVYDGLYVNERGETYYALDYSYLTEDLVKFETADGDLFFNVGEGTFSVNTEEFIIRGDGILYGYQGPTEMHDLELPGEVKEIADFVFMCITRISPIDGNHTSTIDLKNVTKIGAYAFANIKTFNVNEISSDKLLEIGEYAFSWREINGTSMGGNAGVNSLANVNFPAVVKVGAHAFDGCHSLNNGTVTLRDVKEIGEYAFYRSKFVSGECGAIDLSQADLSALRLDPTAILLRDLIELKDVYGIELILGGIQGVAFQKTLPEGARQFVTIKGYDAEDPFAGKGYYDFVNSVYYAFGSTTDYATGIYAVDRYSVSDGAWACERECALYGKDSTGVHFSYGGGAMTAIDPSENVLTINGGEAYQTGTVCKFEVTVGTEKKELSFTLRAAASNDAMYGTSVDLTAENVTFGGKACSGMFDENGTFSCDYDEGSARYTATVDFATMTAEVEQTGIVLYSEDNTYKGVFYDPIKGEEGAYYRLDLSKQNGEAYELVTEDMRRDSKDPEDIFWQTTKTEGEKSTTYTVRIKGDHIEVTTKVEGTKTVEIENEYKVKFRYTNEGEMDSLVEFSIYQSQYKYYEPKYFTFTKSATNTFTAKQGDTVYTVTYLPETGTITVNVEKYTIVEVYTNPNRETDHTEHYGFKILVNEAGEVVGLTGDIFSYEWNNFFSGWDSSSIAMVPDTVRKEGNTFTFEASGSTYTVTVTVTGDAEKTYSGTVTIS